LDESSEKEYKLIRGILEAHLEKVDLDRTDKYLVAQSSYFTGIPKRQPVDVALSHIKQQYAKMMLTGPSAKSTSLNWIKKFIEQADYGELTRCNSITWMSQMMQWVIKAHAPGKPPRSFFKYKAYFPYFWSYARGDPVAGRHALQEGGGPTAAEKQSHAAESPQLDAPSPEPSLPRVPRADAVSRGETGVSAEPSDLAMTPQGGMQVGHVVAGGAKEREGSPAGEMSPPPPVVGAEFAMTKENTAKCLGIVERMLQVETEDGTDLLAKHFVTLPSRKVLPQYYRVIHAPIDIGSIRQALKRTKNRNYSLVQDFISDVELMFTNAKTYNHDTSDIYKNAGLLRKWFGEAVKAEFPVSPGDAREGRELAFGAGGGGSPGKKARKPMEREQARPSCLLCHQLCSVHRRDKQDGHIISWRCKPCKWQGMTAQSAHCSWFANEAEHFTISQ